MDDGVTAGGGRRYEQYQPDITQRLAAGLRQTVVVEHIAELTKVERDGNGARNTDGAGRVTKLTGDEPVSMNYWGFTPQVFDQLRENFEKFLEGSSTDLKSECYIPNTVGELVRAGQVRVKVLHSRDSWFGVTYRADRPRVVESIRGLVAKGTYPETLWPESSRS